MRRHAVSSTSSALLLSLFALLAACGGGDSPSAPTTPTPAPTPTVVSVSVTAPATLTVGGTATATAAVQVTNGASTAVTWTSSNETVATISSAGLITALAPGAVTIRATSTANPTIAGTAAITVILPPVAAIAIAPATVTLQPGGTAPLTATLRDAAGAVLTGRPVEWRSDAPAVATVSATGVVSAVAVGTTSIRATSGAITATAAVTVEPPPVVLIESVGAAAPRGLIGRALAESLTVRVRTAAGAAVANSPVTWSASSGALSATTVTTDASGLARVRYTPALASATVSATASAATMPQPIRFDVASRTSGACTIEPSATTRRFSLGATDFTLNLRATDSLRVAVLFVDFADAPATEQPAQLMTSAITPGLAILRELSYGRTRLVAVPFPKWYRMPNPIGSYSSATFAGHRQYLLDALSVADAEIDFSSFQALYVIVPQHPTMTSSRAFLGGTTANVIADGRNFATAVTFGNSIRTNGPAVTAHETSHMLGLLDLYDFTPAGGPVFAGDQFKFTGAWSLMSNIFVPGHFLMWEKRKLGFVDETQVDCLDGTAGVEAVLTPNPVAGGTKMVVVPIDAGSALVIEARALTGLDQGLCAGGALVYTVDARISSGDGPAQVIGARQSTSGTAFTRCGPWGDGTFGTGTMPVQEYTMPGVAAMRVVRIEPDGSVRVRVTRP